jgi:hypothetical protein
LLVGLLVGENDPVVELILTCLGLVG